MTYTIAQATGSADLFAQFLPLILLFVGMWFLIIGPQRKRQKEHDAMLTALKSGDTVVTSGGIFFLFSNIKEDRLVLRIADNTKIELAKNFVSKKIESE